MKKQIKFWRIGFPAAIAAIILLGASGSIFAQAGIGKLYGTRDPHTCPDRSLPQGNTITADKAKEYFLCGEDHSISNMNLYDEVTVQVGKPRPYNPNEDINVPNIDVSVPVNPIRGSFKQYQCGQADEHNIGKNCNVSEAQHASGLCYKDSFGDWHCSMTDSSIELIARGAPPPGGPVADPKAPSAPKAAPNPEPVKTGQAPAIAKDENGYPIPDMSAMDRWYEITKVEYGDLAVERQIHFIFKPRIEHYSRANLKFEVQYLDATGALIASYPVSPEYFTEIGQVGKGDMGTPSETQMEKVASVKIVRLKQ